MINLIPQNIAVKIKKIYRYRLIATAFFLFTIVVVIMIVALTPSLVVVMVQNAAYEVTSQKIEQEQKNIAELVTSINDANQLSAEIAQYEDPVSFSEIFKLLKSLGGSGIEVHTITYEKQNNQPTQLLVSGTADTRTTLTAYSAALANNEHFTSADIPIQNLAGDRDVDFTITVVLADKETL